MIKTVMKCDCCGKVFYSEHWIGGYIDHYENFARQFDWIIKRDEEDIFYEICYDGNELRDKYDIKCRFECFKKYCEQNDNLDKSQKVSILVKRQIEILQKLDKIHDDIVDMVKGLDDFEKKYIGLGYQKFYSKRLSPTEKGGAEND